MYESRGERFGSSFSSNALYILAATKEIIPERQNVSFGEGCQRHSYEIYLVFEIYKWGPYDCRILTDSRIISR